MKCAKLTVRVGKRPSTKYLNGMYRPTRQRSCNQRVGGINFFATLDLCCCQQSPEVSIKYLSFNSGVCSALDYLHTEKLIMHADIKSANILIKNDFETGLNLLLYN